MSREVFLVEDSFEHLRALPSQSVDVVITDPPYDEHTQNNQVSGTAMRKWVNGEIQSSGIPKKTLPFDPLADYAFVPDLVRIASRWTIIFSTVEAFGEMKRVAPESWVRGCIWYKPNAQGQMTGDRPAACYEGISVLHGPSKKVWNGRGSYGLWPCNSTRGEPDRHPNQKPLSLCLKLVALFSNRGELVFDPFAGSGRIGEACAMLGRRYIGFDDSAEWVAKANARIASVSPQYFSDEDALELCKARNVDMIDTSKTSKTSKGIE